ncbi:crossover junction endodeoxyribonuclease RuvC [Peptoniphilus lacydonensis]|uniref:crossover junction endodeoxyribonuclease RuvC n=1 Tax=Peptoniphilus lacydonensis TaxID=1673725 RepID=UPI00258C1693|nr:crossover junction endodeoxyribonuclease RuvC [Peptoniphilus lacydonensis]MDU1954175.1 crossover junction endodeoxyribonuclease RuvC [Peptoniphilus lacydonensis]MDU5274649.1 crossover junction endodeoxyribonuclease RuvC [Peptoniphilus lacydonensis]MDU5376799.1 crossover junction endodeoxyribonuclease RuvC [Peptoniphilus lacydonensis]MDU5436488.1 crossover junction endodeoxyribonuclease RuvC [Peptoniphilus lacydonensis]MDU7301787.1 crossover junction endodeoxyribonuclease RuvC [Peptoniphilus
MIIMGVDPGIAIVGYGFVELFGNSYKVLDYGAITTKAKIPLPDRLDLIYQEMNDLINQYKPEDIAFEELFFNKNVKTAITVAQARGVEVLVAKKSGANLYEYTPLQVKQALVGYGRATKSQIQDMVKIILNLNKVPKPDDVADALAVAITHGSSIKFKESFRMV